MASGDMVGHKIHKDLQAVLLGPGEQCLEFLDPFGRIHGVVRADVEIVPDGVRTAGDTLQKVGIIGGQSNGGVVAGGGLAENAGDPDGVEAEFFEGGEGWVVQVGKLPATVLLVGAVGNPVGVRVAEQAGKHLVDPQLAGTPWHQSRGGGLLGCGRRDREGKIMRNVPVIFPGKEIRIRGVHDAAPTSVGGHILEGGGHAQSSLPAGPGARDLQLQRTVGTIREFHPGGTLGLRGEAEPVKLAEGDLGLAGGPNEKDVIRLKRQEKSGAGFVLAEGHHAGAVRARGSGND